MKDELFWSKVDVGEPDECWNWKQAVDVSGYGRIHFKNGKVMAHRYAYLITKGGIPEGMQVNHTCDNPACCNPKHLWLGTQFENMRDKREKGRSARGQRIGISKLTPARVAQIRNLYESGVVNQYELADSFGVAQTTIGSIVRRETWKHVE